MSDVVFVDSNILIYAHDVDAGLKHKREIEALRALRESGAGSCEHLWCVGPRGNHCRYSDPSDRHRRDGTAFLLGCIDCGIG
jgi:hypothetical protein